MNSGKLIVLSAPSGSGKTTLVRHLLEQDLPLGFSISATSRKPREKEQDGTDYYFLSANEFNIKIQQKVFLEYEEVYPGTFYGTFTSELKRLWDDEKHVLFDIDVVGGIKTVNVHRPDREKADQNHDTDERAFVVRDKLSDGHRQNNDHHQD